MIGTAFRKRAPHDDVAIGSDFELGPIKSAARATTTTAGVNQTLLKTFFSFVVSHLAGMMLGYAHAHASFESSGRTAGYRISVGPSRSLCSLFQNFYRGERVIG